MSSLFSREYTAVFYLFYLLGGGLVLHERGVTPDGKTHAFFLDVGQGDAMLLVSPSGEHVLVDGGPDFSVLEHLGEIMSFFDRTIELLVLTHPDRDHITALPEILHRYHVRHVLFTGVDHALGRYEFFFALLRDLHIPLTLADPRNDFDVDGDLTINILWPPKQWEEETWDLNDTSIVLRVVSGTSSLLLTGDISARVERRLLALYPALHASILKLPHHGSRFSSSEIFLRSLAPQLAVISSGKGNPYGHPHPEVLERLAALGIPWRSTAEGGTIAFEY